jgi:hypothetical protein
VCLQSYKPPLAFHVQNPRVGGRGGCLLLLAGTTIDFLQEFSEFAGDVSGVAIQDGGISSANLTGVIEDNDLGIEGITALGGVVLGVSADVSTTDFLDGNVLDVETNVVSGQTLNQGFVVHFHTNQSAPTVFNSHWK